MHGPFVEIERREQLYRGIDARAGEQFIDRNY
jgi:hypothetical protein